MSTTPEYREDRAAHQPFRAWALQHDLNSLLGGSADWRVQPEELGLEDERDLVKNPTGQGFLEQALTTDPRKPLRIRTSAALWSTALITDVINQISPIGWAMEPGPFWFIVASIVVALVAVLFLYPRISLERFVIIEQCVLTFATLLIFYQVSQTGGNESPYLIWYLLTAYYAGYLLPRGQGQLNILWILLMVGATQFLSISDLNPRVELQLAALVVVIGLLSLALMRQRTSEDTLERAVNFMALADPLTSTANARSFERFLEELTRRDGQRFALLTVGLNGLKGTNAVFGHDTGDGMLVRTARLMLQASGSDDQVARLGGDEFAVLIPDGREGDVNRWRKEFELQVARHNDAIRGRLPQISTSVGVALYPEDGVTANALFDVADRQLRDERSNAVVQPYEVEEATSAAPGHALRSARFQDAPLTPVDVRERMRFAGLNWLTSGILVIGVAIAGGPSVMVGPAIVCGSFGIVVGITTLVFRYLPLTRPVMYGLDIASMLYPLPFILTTGGGESPLLVMTCLPIAFYAQNYPRKDANLRIALILAGASAGFWLTGLHGPKELTWYITSLAAMIVIAAVMQYSSGSLTESLKSLRTSATHDDLTGLRNVYALRHDLERSLRRFDGHDQSRVPGIILIDLDNFRRANAVAGHRGGDAILQAVAEDVLRVAGHSPSYRVEADEFAVLLEGLTGRALESFAQRCAESIERGVGSGAGEFELCASVGFAGWSEGITAEEMMDQAGLLVGESKSERRDHAPQTGQRLL